MEIIEADSLYTYHGIDFICDVDISEDEAKAYIDRVFKQYYYTPVALDCHVDGEFIDIHYTWEEVPKFQRIRRITGYLVGTLDRFNDAKRAEESERVKHGVGGR